MCLDVVFRGQEKKDELAKLPDVVTVWKVVYKLDKRDYRTDCMFFPLHAGEVKFIQNVINTYNYNYNLPKYRGGGHFFLSRSVAYSLRWDESIEKVVKCRVKKEWINNIGLQSGAKIVVVKRAIFPAYFGGVK